ncbi:DUF4162 domain-containing protein [Alkalibacillus haloalkaliphilus]|uniref:ATP-binding protein DrrA1-3 family domain-containing protein n=1 Tax=Alkalibacillus haloalkaliphilus TaxID=94136 RepID=UPI003C2C2A3D
MNLVEEMCDRLFMINRGQKVIYGSLKDVKSKYANFKCTILGDNPVHQLKSINQVSRVEQEGHSSVLYLEQGIELPSWLHTLPNDLDIVELKVDRISLHEIFVDVALGRSITEEVGGTNA